MRTLSLIVSELTFAARRLAADRWATAAAILAIAIGAGLNTAVFAAAYGILLRPLPFKEPARLAVVDVVRSTDKFGIGVRLPELDEWRRSSRGFDGMAAYVTNDLVVRGAGGPRLVHAAIVSGSFFDVLGAAPSRGRFFTTGSADETLVVVSDRLAHELFGSVDAAKGRGLVIGGVAVTISGVASRDIGFPADETDLWIPATAVPAIQFGERRDARHYRVLGRLRAGVTFDQARGELQRFREARAESAASTSDRTGPPMKPEDVTVATVVPIEETLFRTVRPIVWAFSAGVAIVLLIACANVATILVGRTIARQRELAVQRALGASAMRLAASLIAESFVIAMAGSTLGLLMTWAILRVLRSTGANLIARLQNVTFDWHVFLFASLLSLVVAIVAAIAPARRGLAASLAGLRSGGASAARPARRTRALLSVAQVALAVIVLSGGALLVRTVIGLLSVDTGVNPDGAVSLRLLVTDTKGIASADRTPLIRELLDRVRSLPGVTSAGVGANLPPLQSQIDMAVRTIIGNRDATLMLTLAPLTEGYLDALGARVLRGRLFTVGDTVPPHTGVILSATAARHMFESIDVIGRPLPLNLPGMSKGARPFVVGVVDDVRYAGLEKGVSAAVYVPWQALPLGQVFLVVRGSGDPIAMAAEVRKTVRELDPALPVLDSHLVEDVIKNSVADRRLSALLSMSIALLAFALALVGLTGGLLHAVTERRRELAIRAALGATPFRTMRVVLGEGAMLIGVGLIAGLAASLAINRVLAGLLYGVSSSDPTSLTLVAALVAMIGIAVCYVPARLAANTDPVELLRAD